MTVDTRQPDPVSSIAINRTDTALLSALRRSGLRDSPVWTVLTACLTGLAVTFAVARASGPLRDPDTLWHVSAGGYVLQSGRLAGPDPWGQFSSHTWVLHEWLSEVLMYLAYRAGGLLGLATLHAMTLAGLAVLLLWLTRCYAGAAAGSLIAFMTLFAMAGSLGPRPQVASFVLLAIVLAAWLRTTRDLRPRWWLVPLSWAWACLHGLWLVGVAVGVVVTVGLLLDRRLSRADARRLTMVPLGMFVAAALTPIGPRLLTAPFTVRGYAQFVQEWDRPSLTQPRVVVALCLLALAMLVWTRTGPVSWWRLGLWALALVSTVQYERTVAVGALIGSCLAAEAVGTLTSPSVPALPPAPDAITRTVSAVSPWRPNIGWPRQVVLDVVICGVVLGAALPGLVRTTGELGGVPSGMSTTLAALPQGSVVLNEYELGGWLLWSQPQLEPVIDPRTEVYSVPYVQRYVDARGVRPGWQDFVTDTGARWAILDKRLPLTGALQDTLHWKVTARDGDWLLLQGPR